MDREKQIEEIANVIYDDPNAYDTYWRSDCGCNGTKPLERPPQSWCYV